MFITSERMLITALKSLSVLFRQFMEGLNERKKTQPSKFVTGEREGGVGVLSQVH